MVMSSANSRNPSPLRPPYNGYTSYRPETAAVDDDLHPVIHAGRVAVVTGAASGIGKAAAIEFAKCVLRPLLGSPTAR
jgi:hypothetical protein